MGNVHASAPPPPLTPIPEPQPVKEVPSPSEDSKSKPGTLEELHKKCKDVFPMPFQGARIVFNRGLSNHFQINHTASMSSSMPPGQSGYKFGATYVGSQIVGPGEAYPVLLGDIDPSGNLNANILCQFHPRLRTRAVVQIQDSKTAGYQVSNDYRGKNYTSSVILGNIDPVMKAGMSVFHYLQTVSPTLDLGTELAVQFGPQTPGGIFTALSLAGRYSSPDKRHIFSGTLSPQQVHVCYYQKASENLQYGVEVETNLRMGESYAKFGYQLDLPKAEAVFRGSIDSDFGITGVYEKKLAPLPLTFSLSGHVRQGWNPMYGFGIGLMLG
ncbi:mitochondrial import receptor subunit TOM40 homolog 1-like [Brevipalpus obovatus]|uniref:mitochondrial import receptor subunit TOM40 homolog 1-like n=1 Tax=Brevipalpus obovatus TaxID=246614 RepID=UPI003D9F690C